MAGMKSKKELAKKVMLEYMDGKDSLTALSKKHGIRRETVWKWNKRFAGGSVEKNKSIFSKIKSFLVG